MEERNAFNHAERGALDLECDFLAPFNSSHTRIQRAAAI
jgi:hypothetical protein